MFIPPVHVFVVITLYRTSMTHLFRFLNLHHYMGITLFFSLLSQILGKRTTVLACIGPFFSLISQILEKWTTPLGMHVTFL